MASPKKVDIDEKDIQRAQDMWDKFTHLSKYTIIGTIIILIVMAAIFVDW